MTKGLYIKAIAIVLFVAVPFNVIRLFSDMYGAAVIAILQLVFAKQIYNFMAGKDMSFAGASAGKNSSFDVRVFTLLCFVLMYFGLFFV